VKEVSAPQDAELIVIRDVVQSFVSSKEDEASSGLSAWLSYARNKGRSRLEGHVVLCLPWDEALSEITAEARSCILGVSFVRCSV
jgi:hypothetical protein